MINVGIAGIGFMGWIHWLAYKKASGIRIAAISSREPKRRAGDWRDIKGNFGPPGEQVDLKGVRTFERLEEMLADPSIDLVDLCLPPHLHAEATLRALAAGKHVFCEKPLALTEEECVRMVAAAKKAGKQLFAGHVLPFFPEYAEARRIIAEGKHGKLLGGWFKRVISDPTWLPDFYDPVRVGVEMRREAEVDQVDGGVGEHRVEALEGLHAAQVHLLAGRAEVALDAAPVARPTLRIARRNRRKAQSGDRLVREPVDPAHEPDARDPDVDHRRLPKPASRIRTGRASARQNVTPSPPRAMLLPTNRASSRTIQSPIRIAA